MTWTHPAYETIARLVAARTGLHCSPGREDRTESAIQRAMGHRRAVSPEAYRDLLANDDAVLDDLVGELTVGETYFFREPDQFAFLRREALPDLRRRRGPDHVFRVWSAGCASGEEAYSLAILFEQEGLGERSHVLATDITRDALARARQAVYGEWSLRGEGAAVAGLYLTRHGKAYRLDDRIRRRVRIEYLNLARDVYPSFATDTWGLDLILCRNVLIYLDRDTSERVASRLFQSLAPGGWLLTASSDPPLQEWAPLATVVTDAGVFYRRPQENNSEFQGLSSESACGKPLSPCTQGERGWGEGVDFPRVSRPLTPNPSPPSTGERGVSHTHSERGRQGTQNSELRTQNFEQRVRKLAGENVDEAERVCTVAVAEQPLSVELHYLHAVLRMDLGREEEAITALRKVVYLDRSLAVAHFTLGSLLWRRGDRDGARMAYRNALALCGDRPAEEAVPLGDGECAGRLARAAAFQLELLDDGEEADS